MTLNKAQGCDMARYFGCGIDRCVLVFAISFIFLTILDFVTTMFAISNGLGHEANPIMAMVTSNNYLFALTKISLGALIIYMMNRIYSKNKKLAMCTITIIITMMFAVVINNLFVIGVI